MRYASLVRTVPVFLILTALVAAGCTAPTAPAPPAAPAGGDSPAASAPVQPKVNRLVMAVPAPPTEYNEPRLGSQPTAWHIGPMYEHLIGVDAENGKLVPHLATEWKLEPDGTSFRFQLRKGVQFQKGAGEFTAKDVVFTHENFIKPDSIHGEVRYWRDLVKEIRVIGDYEVVLPLTRPDGDFLNAIARQQGDIFPILSKADFDKAGVPTMQTGPTAGTAPYGFKERQQGNFVRFERVAFKHWRVTPDFPEFEFRWVREASTRLAGLVTGELHVAPLPEDLVKQASTQGLNVVRSRLPGLRVFGSLYCCFVNVFNDPSRGMYAPPEGPSPMADVRVRKALNKAINRDDLNKAFFGGKGEPMYANHLHPSRPGWNAEYERRFPEAYGFDVNAARALLAEAGYTAANPMEAYISLQEAAGIAGSNDISEAIGQYWTAIGVKVQYEQGDAAARTVLRRERKQTNHFGLTGTAAAPLIGLVWNSTSGGRNSNFSGAQDIDLENVVKRLYDTIETEKQEPLFRQAGEVVFAKYLSVPLFWLRAEAVVNPKIVADYSFSGTISGTWTHVEYIKAAK